MTIHDAQDDVSADVEEIWNRLLITQTLERYCRGADRRDQVLMESAFWPDAIIDIGPWTGTGAEFGSFLMKRMEDAATTMHIIAQTNLEIKGDVAFGDIYFMGRHRHEHEGKVSLLRAYGRYVDKFERRAAEWRILKRTVVMEHIQNDLDVKTDDLNIGDFSLGKKDRSDVSYQGRICR